MDTVTRTFQIFTHAKANSMFSSVQVETSLSYSTIYWMRQRTPHHAD